MKMCQKNGPPDSANAESQLNCQEPATISVTQQQHEQQADRNKVKVVIASVKPSQKSVLDAYILGIPLGFLGAHHFYLRRPGWGVLYLLTFGLLGVGWVADWFRMACLVAETNRRLVGEKPTQRKLLSDAYILWFPFGLIGFHHYYLRRPCWGIAYTCTFGILGIGWLIDAFRLPGLVSSVNIELESRALETPPNPKPIKRLCDAYVLGVSPAGIVGCHHFYLRNYGFGVLYLCTLGLVGVGWIVDWFRMPTLTKRANKRIQEGDDLKYLDQAYLLAFPLGFLGLHHFYLRRPCWGLLYIFTFGFLGIGWIIDFFRMPCLVKSVNERTMKEREIVETVRQTVGPNTHVVVTETPHDGSNAGLPSGQPLDVQHCQGHYQGAVAIYPPQGIPGAIPYTNNVIHYPPSYETATAAPPAYSIDNPDYDNKLNEEASAPPCPRKNPNAMV